MDLEEIIKLHSEVLAENNLEGILFLGEKNKSTEKGRYFAKLVGTKRYQRASGCIYMAIHKNKDDDVLTMIMELAALFIAENPSMVNLFNQSIQRHRKIIENGGFSRS